MKKLFIFCLLVSSMASAQAEEIYQVESAANDEYLIINGYNFAAKSYCHDFQLGDQVVFLDGDPEGICTDALILNLRNNQACNTWCQSIF